MADLNHVILVGRLTKDAELKYTNSGLPLSKFSIALNRRKKVEDQWQEEVHFFDIVVWGKIAEVLHPYLKKGKQVGIDGELRQNRWEQDGQSRSKVEVVANNIQLMGSARGEANGNSRGAPQQEGPVSVNEPEINDNFEDDIPF